MKPEFSTAKSAEYNVLPPESFQYLTLKEAADKLGISPQRMSRLLRILEVPVHRRGHTILLDGNATNRIGKALKDNEVSPGRKKKESNPL